MNCITSSIPHPPPELPRNILSLSQKKINCTLHNNHTKLSNLTHSALSLSHTVSVFSFISVFARARRPRFQYMSLIHTLTTTCIDLSVRSALAAQMYAAQLSSQQQQNMYVFCILFNPFYLFWFCSFIVDFDCISMHWVCVCVWWMWRTCVLCTDFKCVRMYVCVSVCMQIWCIEHYMIVDNHHQSECMCVCVVSVLVRVRSTK